MVDTHIKSLNLIIKKKTKTIQCHYAPRRITKIKKIDNTWSGQDCKQPHPSSTECESVYCALALKNCLTEFIKA